jgi:phenol 2-monooxygenase
MENMKDTQWDFALVLRQKYQEEIIRNRLKEEGVTLEAPAELVGLDILDLGANDGYRACAMVQDGITGRKMRIMCRYLVGADGGRSFVR